MVKDHVRGARGGARRPPVHRLARWDGWCRGAAGGGTPAPSAMTPAAGSAVSASLPRSRWGSPTLPVGEHLLHNDAGESTSVPPRPSLPLLSPSLQRRIGPLEGPSPQVPDWQAAMLAASHQATSRRSRFPRHPPRTARGAAQRGHPRLPTRRRAAGRRAAVDPSPGGELRASAQSRGKRVEVGTRGGGIRGGARGGTRRGGRRGGAGWMPSPWRDAPSPGGDPPGAPAQPATNTCARWGHRRLLDSGGGCAEAAAKRGRPPLWWPLVLPGNPLA